MVTCRRKRRTEFCNNQLAPLLYSTARDNFLVASSPANNDLPPDLITSNDPYLEVAAIEPGRQVGSDPSPSQPDPTTAEFRRQVATMQLTKAVNTTTVTSWTNAIEMN